MIDFPFTEQNLEWILTSGAHFFRHDVDYNLGCAVKMAQFEKNFNIRSVYYLRTRSETYTVSSQAFKDAAAQIMALGHTIGLHVDLELPRDAKVTAFQLRKAALEQQWEMPIAFSTETLPHLSFHAPPRDVLWRSVPGYVHAMSSEWAGRYISDSRGVWQGDPRLVLARGDDWQVNLHPEWWFLPAAQAQELREAEALKP